MATPADSLAVVWDAVFDRPAVPVPRKHVTQL